MDMNSTMMQFAPIVLMIVAFYFLLIRPQQKRAKEQQNMLGALKKGDRVITSGGIIGTITKLTDAELTVEAGAGVEITVLRSSVAQTIPTEKKTNLRSVKAAPAKKTTRRTNTRSTATKTRSSTTRRSSTTKASK